MEVVTRWTSCVPPLWVVIFKKNVLNFGVLLDIQNLRTRLSNFFLKTQQRSGKQRTRGSSRAISSLCLKVHLPHTLLLIGILYKSVRLVDLFNVLSLSVRVSKLSEGVTCDDCYYSSVQPVVVGVFFLLSWSFQHCCAFRSDLIVGRSDLRRLLHASAASSHRVGTEVQVQVFRSSKLGFGFFYLLFILARSCADLKIVADENTEEVKKIRHIKVEN